MYKRQDHLSGSDSSSDPSYRIDVDVITRGGNVSVRPTSASVGTRVARIVVMNWTGLSCLTRPELNLLSPSGTRIPTPLSCLTAAAALTLTLCEWRCPVPVSYTHLNVVHVNDLVDNVSAESALAGCYAAKYAMGTLPQAERTVACEPGRNVRYLCPQGIQVLSLIHIY